MRGGKGLLGPGPDLTVVRDCDMVSCHSLLGIGSELSGGIRNVWMTRCTVADTYAMLRIKTGPRRGGFVENVWIDHCRGQRMNQVVDLMTDYCAQWGRFPDYELRQTQIRNIHVSDLVADRAEVVIRLHGSAEQPPEDISISNVCVSSARALRDIRNCGQVNVVGLVVNSTQTFPNTQSAK